VRNAIFISYRRDDSEGEAGRLFDDLIRAFGADNVFMDVAGIKPGVDFRLAIEQNVANCGVLLAVIGPVWGSITKPGGERRLDDPNDFVALEIASALERKVPVIPVLVHEARMPSPDQLPESVKDLSYRNSVELSHARWNSDVNLLVQALASYVTPTAATAQEPVHATVSVQLPPPHPAPPIPNRAPKKSKLFIGIAAAVVLGIVCLSMVVHYAGGSSSPKSDSSESAAVDSNASDGSASTSNAAKTSEAAAPAASLGIKGDWHDTVARPNNSLYSLAITGSGGALAMHAVGSCEAGTCDWGTQPAAVDGEDVVASFNPAIPGGTRVAEVSVYLDGESLDVTVHNTFVDQYGTHKNEIHRLFVRGQ
jgi:TIR domain